MNRKIIEVIMEQRGIKWSWLIDRSNYSRVSFYHYLNGRRTPPQDFVDNISKALGVEPSVICESLTTA
jgi:hypothetical protein